jgi:predicted ArsR family transcriptional regulator
MSNQSADAVFDALGEPVRRRILELLHDGPVPVGRLAEQLPVGRPAVSKHLKVLSDVGLVGHRSSGTRNLYLLAPSGLAVAQQWLVSMWTTVLDAYADEVERTVSDRSSRAPLRPGPDKKLPVPDKKLPVPIR